MHGGQLSTQNIVIIPELDILIAAYAHQLYFFRLAEATIANKHAHHEHPIISIHYNPNSKIFTSIDHAGIVFSAKIDAHGKLVAPHKRKLSLGENVSSAHIGLNKEGGTVIYAISVQNKLVRFVDGVTGLVKQKCQKLLYVTEQLVIVRSEGRKVWIIDADTLHQKFQYQHSKSKVSSVQIFKQNMIVGDEAGKITILSGFLEAGEVQLKQKLQWHVHEVSALKVDQSYLYSGGEEGVVVLWHLRENKRDFLPRVGATITNIQIVQSKIYCILSDNSIKSIDLNNDKAVRHYKTIIDTRGGLIAQSSKARVRSNLIKVSPMQDQLFLRSQPGKIQSIHLGNGVNTQFSIISRNSTSRLDSGYPNPHQITDIAFSKDFSQFVAAIQGVNCRSLKFYFQDQGEFQLLSKVENCHKGSSPVNLLTFGDKFISYSESDSAIKVWKRMTRKKESILEVQQHYWACQYEISYRNKLPSFVNISGDNLIVVYEPQFVLFNTKTKKIEGVYSANHQDIVGVYPIDTKHKSFLIVYPHRVERVELTNNKSKVQLLISLNSQSAQFKVNNIVVNQRQQTIALLVSHPQYQHVYIYKYNKQVQMMEIPTQDNRVITDLFWIGPRLLAFDSLLAFHDLTHSQELVQLHQKQQIKPQLSQEMQSQQTEINDYDHLYTKYLERQYRRDRASIDKSSQLLQITPSITSSLQLFTSQLFL